MLIVGNTRGGRRDCKDDDRDGTMPFDGGGITVVEVSRAEDVSNGVVDMASDEAGATAAVAAAAAVGIKAKVQDDDDSAVDVSKRARLRDINRFVAAFSVVVEAATSMFASSLAPLNGCIIVTLRR